jgi:hypothetical protein
MALRKEKMFNHIREIHFYINEDNETYMAKGMQLLDDGKIMCFEIPKLIINNLDISLLQSDGNIWQIKIQ